MKMMLEIANLEVVYKKSILALEGISAAIPKGCIVAMIGSNGAGKTTMLRAITGLLRSQEGRITKGRVLLEGRMLSNLNPSKIVEMGVRLVPEGRRVFADLTVEENLMAGGHVIASRRVMREGMDSVFEIFPLLSDYRRRIAGYMSGGEQQMLAIGRALISSPSLLMLDEPSLGLAPIMIDEIFRAIEQIHSKGQTTVLLVEQSAIRSLELASFGYILQSGRVVFEGTSEMLKNHEDVQEFYLGIGKTGEHRSFKKIKTYRRRKRWLT